MTLNRRGRPRKVPEQDVRLVVMNQPHRRHLKVVKDERGKVITDHRLDQKAESVLGRLTILGFITEQQYLAGRKLALVVNKYRAVISSPDPLQKPVPGSGADIPPDEARRRKEIYDEVYMVLGDCGQRVQKACSKVCVYDHTLSPPHITLEQLSTGLEALVRYFGLTAGRKSGYG